MGDGLTDRNLETRSSRRATWRLARRGRWRWYVGSKAPRSSWRRYRRRV